MLRTFQMTLVQLKHVRDIVLQSIQLASNYFENQGSNVILAIILQNMKHLCHCKTDSNLPLYSRAIAVICNVP